MREPVPESMPASTLGLTRHKKPHRHTAHCLIHCSRSCPALRSSRQSSSLPVELVLFCSAVPCFVTGFHSLYALVLKWECFQFVWGTSLLLLAIKILQMCSRIDDMICQLVSFDYKTSDAENTADIALSQYSVSSNNEFQAYTKGHMQFGISSTLKKKRISQTRTAFHSVSISFWIRREQ
jgi:hypothetical protein